MTNSAIIEKFIVGRVEPHIYAFETGTVPNYLKIGDTYRPVETRLNEWRRYFADLQKKYDEPATAGDEYFRDLSVHEYIIREKGRKRLEKTTLPDIPYYSNEFFENATTGDVDEAIQDIRKSATDKDGRYKLYSMKDGRVPVDFHYVRGEEPIVLRPNQEAVVKRFIEAKNHRRTHLLMYAVMRFGKSITAMSCAKAMDAHLVVVVSAKADVKTEWKKTVESFKNFEGYEFADSDDLKRNDSLIKQAKRERKNLVVCLTLQDLSSKEVKARHKDLFRQSIDLLIVDETHFGARAEHYGKVLPPVGATPKQERKYDAESADELDIQVKQLNAKMQLHLSGTPYRILMGDEFTDEDVICYCQFSDIAQASEEWDKANLDTKDEWENPYYGFPQMVRFAFNPNESSLRKLAELQKNGITIAFSELFKPKSITKSAEGLHQKFEHEAEILDFLHAIDGTEEDGNILSFLANERIQNGKLCRHIVCVLPYRASCDAMEQLLVNHANEFKHLSNYTILNISGVENERLFPNVDSVKKRISDFEANDQKTITLTVSRMMTGVTVPEWDTMLYLKDTASPQEYDQAIFRLQSPYVKTYKDEEGNEIRYNMKPQTLLVDFDPNRMFILQELRAHIYDINTDANGNSNLERRIERELQVSPIIWMNKQHLQEVTPANILDAVRAYSNERSVLDEAKEVPADLSLGDIDELNAIIMRQQPIGSRGGLKVKPAEEEGDDDLDVPDVPDSGEPSEKKPKEESETKEDNSFEKRLQTLYSRILLYAFLTNDEVISLEAMVLSACSGSNNKRILVNLGLDVKTLKLLFKHLNPNVLHQLDYKIHNINSLAHDESLSPIERVENAMRKFGRWSTSEIVTPNHLATQMLSELPRKQITADTKFMDIASKEGEFAYAIIQTFGEHYKDKIYSIPTSTIAYEFTRKVYEALGMPIENIENEFNSYDLIGENAEVHINKIKSMCINIAVGNPPYQDEGGSGGTNDAPIYQKFCKVAKENTSSMSSLVIPAKWFTGGREHLLGEFRRDMLSSNEVSCLTAYPNHKELFPEVELKGGVCYFVRGKKYDGACNYSTISNGVIETAEVNLSEMDVFVREPLKAKIVAKVLAVAKNEGQKFVSEILSSDTPFGVPTNPTKNKKVVYEVQNSKDDEFSVELHYLINNKRHTGYIKKDSIKKNSDDIDKIKVYVPAAGGSGNDKIVLGKPIIAMPPSVCSQTYLYATFASLNEAENFVSYLKTRFFRFLVSAIKITQHAQSSVYKFVPVHDFSEVWTDERLFAKYGIIEDEKEYIMAGINVME
ncbi:MAG: Eco57I restriction-modification methylase domain-containing protein [Paludibacteraceae bacterium]|nr:Eco57I restriction-modification methylase domain-containing protein [Paludibacteraceae bacterium]